MATVGRSCHGVSTFVRSRPLRCNDSLTVKADTAGSGGMVSVLFRSRFRVVVVTFLLIVALTFLPDFATGTVTNPVDIPACDAALRYFHLTRAARSTRPRGSRS